MINAASACKNGKSGIELEYYRDADISFTSLISTNGSLRMHSVHFARMMLGRLPRRCSEIERDPLRKTMSLIELWSEIRFYQLKK